MYKLAENYTNRLKYLLLILLLGLSSCATNKRISQRLAKTFKASALLKQYQVGFALYDKDKKEMIFEQESAKYFTPASNTKLFTFYAGLKVIPDSIPSIRYVTKGDSLIFWGTGDPSFLQSQLKGKAAFDFLKATDKKLFFASGRYTGDFYGNGWQWDDYNAYYQAEINELPIMDNLVSVSSDGAGGVAILPRTFNACFVKDSTANGKTFTVTRDFNANWFHYPKIAVPAQYTQQVPYKVSATNTISLLADTLHKPVGLVHMPLPANAKTIFGLQRDSVFKQMLLPSDNFVAEQLLLVYADQLGIEMNTQKVIERIEKQYLTDLPDKPKWVDGSGLSRGNLFTPRTMVKLLELIYHEVNNEQRLFALLPAGGKTGTLKNAYPKTDTPFVFGKTGSLSNNHNQSGYVVTKKGKVFIFSFMNNSFVLPTADIRKEMVRIMTDIHEKF